MAQPRFRYRLQQVLELKIKAEDEEKEKLAKLIQLQAEELKIKAQLEAKLVQLGEELRARQANGTLDINQIVNQELRLKEIAIRIAQQRENLMRAAQERQAYEKNKETSKERWTAEMEQAESKMLDELATLKSARGASAQ